MWNIYYYILNIKQRNNKLKFLTKNKNNKKDKQMIYLILIDSILSLKQKKNTFLRASTNLKDGKKCSTLKEEKRSNLKKNVQKENYLKEEKTDKNYKRWKWWKFCAFNPYSNFKTNEIYRLSKFLA